MKISSLTNYRRLERAGIAGQRPLDVAQREAWQIKLDGIDPRQGVDDATSLTSFLRLIGG